MLVVKQISSLEKVRVGDSLRLAEITSAKVLKGERYSYQISAISDKLTVGKIVIESELLPYIKVYSVEQSPMDMPTSLAVLETDYITVEPGLMPDLLVPLEESHNLMQLHSVYARNASNPKTIWIEVTLPKDIKAKSYDITTKLLLDNGTVAFTRVMTLSVIDVVKVDHELVYSRWFYADCISNYHGVAIHSDEHFALMEEYIREAVDVGVNMILVPIHTPPLDTAIGTQRPCVQLVDIKKEGDTYIFGFEKLRRFVDICKRAGVRYYEMAHMFSQWGAKCAANIMVEENGVSDYMFGWHVSATDPKYQEFLKQYIAAVYGELSALGVADDTYFHISDEPTLEHIDAYKAAADIIRPLIGKSKTLDALSNYAFYEKGLVECPITGINHLDDFLPHNIPNQFTYYCCSTQTIFPNCFLAMSSHRTRMLGIMLYKFDIKGFLQWGLNFYNASHSLSQINPYVTTSANGAFPSGDPFILYPALHGAYPSIRAKVTHEAFGDYELCKTLENYIGRDAVVAMIDEIAGGDVRLSDYPRDETYLLKLRDAMLARIEECAKA